MWKIPHRTLTFHGLSEAQRTNGEHDNTTMRPENKGKITGEDDGKQMVMDLIQLRNLHRNEYNPRFLGRDKDDYDVSDLADDIEKNTLINPPTVRPLGEENEDGEEQFEVVAGERRFLAKKEISFERWDMEADAMPCAIRGLNDEQARQFAIAENAERQDLTTIQEAKAFAQEVQVEVSGEDVSYLDYVFSLNTTHSDHDAPKGVEGGTIPSVDINDEVESPSYNLSSVRELSETVGVGGDTISNRLKLLLLPPKAYGWVDDGNLSLGAATSIVEDCRRTFDSAEQTLAEIADYAEQVKDGDIGVGDVSDELEARKESRSSSEEVEERKSQFTKSKLEEEEEDEEAEETEEESESSTNPFTNNEETESDSSPSITEEDISSNDETDDDTSEDTETPTESDGVADEVTIGEGEEMDESSSEDTTEAAEAEDDEEEEDVEEAVEDDEERFHGTEQELFEAVVEYTAEIDAMGAMFADHFGTNFCQPLDKICIGSYDDAADRFGMLKKEVIFRETESYISEVEAEEERLQKEYDEELFERKRKIEQQELHICDICREELNKMENVDVSELLSSVDEKQQELQMLLGNIESEREEIQDKRAAIEARLPEVKEAYQPAKELYEEHASDEAAEVFAD